MILGRSVAIVGIAAFGALAATAQAVSAQQGPARPASVPAAVAPLVELPIEFEKNLPLASIRVNGHRVLFILDSAAEGCVLDAKKASEVGVKGTASAMTSGSGGMTSVELARRVRLGLGPLEIVPDFVIRFSTHSGGSLDTEGFGANLGNGFLSRYVATFDVPHGRLLLRRPKLGAIRFAPETIGGADCFCHTFTPDGRTAVFVRSKRGLFEARLEADRWSEPKPLPFSGAADVRDGDPFFSPDGSRLYFWSSREGRTNLNTDLYVVERRVDGWGVPRNLGPPVNNEVNEPFPAVAADGTLYFGSARPGSGGIDLYRARPRGSSYAEPENLGAAVNSPELDLDGYVSPDQATLVFASNRPGGYGKLDLYVSRWKDGTWSAARNIGPPVNSPGDEFCPQILDGGRLLLFSRGAPDVGVFQIDASVLEDPKP